ncbi:GntR family transcriptional regulator [Streptomyces cremeus]|uniref:GntR family transcriptional regulator n=1 Tax=Streptomyces cremeus TaxID=66881 RepID=A0ABV5P6P4_STRCM
MGNQLAVSQDRLEKAQYNVTKRTAREALAPLEAEGLVDVVRRRGTVVRTRSPRRRPTRGRQVHRDERGYCFDASAQPWAALEPPPSPGRPPSVTSPPSSASRRRASGSPRPRAAHGRRRHPHPAPARHQLPLRHPRPRHPDCRSRQRPQAHPPPKPTGSTWPKASRCCASPAPLPTPSASQHSASWRLRCPGKLVTASRSPADQNTQRPHGPWTKTSTRGPNGYGGLRRAS